MQPVLLSPNGQPLEPGWLLPYLLEGDLMFCNGRWDWWTDVCLSRKVPAGPIPQLNLNDHAFDSGNPPDDCISPDTYGVGKTCKHLTDICEKMASGGRYYTDECLLYLAEWCLYGFGARKELTRTLDANDILYTDFQLGRLQQNAFDYPAHLYTQMIGKSARGNGFFPTPPNIVRMMTMIALGVPTDDAGYEALKPQTVLDPCGGTGIMLLYASDYCLNLYYQDIDPRLCTLAEFNAWLYAPWLAWRPKWEAEIEGLFAPEPERVKQAIASAKQDAHGQLFLF